MMVKFSFHAILILFFLFSCHKSEIKPILAEKGVLNLRNHGFQKTPSIKLNGEWVFFWQKFINPQQCIDALQCTHTGDIITVPGLWDDFRVNKRPVGGKGYASYSLQVILPPEKNGLALKIPTLSSTYRLYINGKLVSEVGKVGKTKEETKSAYYPQIIPISGMKIIKDRPLRVVKIILHISNFDNARGGLWTEMVLGKVERLRRQREKNIALDLFLFGALLITGLYHLGLFALRRKDKLPLYFGLFCLIISFRPIFTGESFFITNLPDFPWLIALKIEYLTIYLGTPLFLLYLDSLFPEEIPQKLQKGLLLASGILSLAVILFPPAVFTHTLFSMQLILLTVLLTGIFVMCLSMYHRHDGAVSFFTGFIIFSLIIINDLLNSNQIIHTGFFSPIGFLVFIFSQSFFLSTRLLRFNENRTFRS